MLNVLGTWFNRPAIAEFRRQVIVSNRRCQRIISGAHQDGEGGVHWTRFSQPILLAIILAGLVDNNGYLCVAGKAD